MNASCDDRILTVRARVVIACVGPQPMSMYGKFTWKIENFSTIAKRELRSNVFEVGGYKWCVRRCRVRWCRVSCRVCCVKG